MEIIRGFLKLFSSWRIALPSSKRVCCAPRYSGRGAVPGLSRADLFSLVSNRPRAPLKSAILPIAGSTVFTNRVTRLPYRARSCRPCRKQKHRINNPRIKKGRRGPFFFGVDLRRLTASYRRSLPDAPAGQTLPAARTHRLLWHYWRDQ